MELSDLERQRLEKLERLRERGWNPYPPRVERTHTAAQAIAAYEAGGEGLEVAVTGRLRSIRVMGKVSFAHVEDESGRIQLLLRMNDLGQEMYEAFRRDFDLGDFVEAQGSLMRTRTGEITVCVDRLRMLSKALTPLPWGKERRVADQVVRYSTLTDVEERYRQRYADLAVHPEVREIFRIRARTVAAIRRFLDRRGFLEVETPILQPIYGGAAARPFTTHHNQLDQDLYLRISDELYLKRLLVGGYERVYEIGKDFRNEGVSYKHNPEFTMLEFYAAYLDYRGVMDLCEEMVATAAQEVLGTTTVTYQGHTINLSPPWRRVTLRKAIREVSGIDYLEHPTAEALMEALRAIGRQPEPCSTWGKLIDNSLLGTMVEPTLIQPTIVYDYPRDISPLAKAKPDDPTHVERFEFFIGGLEMGNAFTELNDPLDQERRFLEMGRLYAAEDEEAHPMDDDYVRAMMYGMPPNGGFGMGVDRLVMIFTDRPSIREVILYPHLRPREKGQEAGSRKEDAGGRKEDAR
ncbi:MAG TPA: lysine--tRNA ligase [Chloroflexi bacterium]|nr:lysine--tRNA ligase [Chloroflexota bacterium]